MNTYIAVIFSSADKAHNGLRKLWDLDEKEEMTVHGAAVVHRDDKGHIQVAERHSDLGMRTAVGVGIGALLGLVAGPVGAAVGAAGAAALSLEAAVGVGALAGAAVGATADAITESQRETAAEESFFTLRHGQFAVVAEITEHSTLVLDDAMTRLSGTVFRRLNTATTNAAFGASYYGDYLYPYYYQPF